MLLRSKMANIALLITEIGITGVIFGAIYQIPNNSIILASIWLLFVMFVLTGIAFCLYWRPQRSDIYKGIIGLCGLLFMQMLISGIGRAWSEFTISTIIFIVGLVLAILVRWTK